MTDTLAQPPVARQRGRHAGPFLESMDSVPPPGTLVLARAARHRKDAGDGSAVGAPALRHRLLRRVAGERGAATAEYAVATMAAVGFAGLLVVILRGDEVRGILMELVRNALSVG